METSVGKALAAFGGTGVGKALNYLDVAAEGFERGVGLLGQFATDQFDDPGFNLRDAWYAGSLAYDMTNMPTFKRDKDGKIIGLSIPTDLPDTVGLGFAAVFDSASIARLGLDRPIADDWQSAQEREIHNGHCGALPPATWPRLARAQFARDAVMAHALRQHAQGGIVLLAGNGHVRRDIGVPRWLDGDQRRTFTVAYLEDDDGSTPVAAFDAVVRTEVAARSDPCETFKRGASEK